MHITEKKVCEDCKWQEVAEPKAATYFCQTCETFMCEEHAAMHNSLWTKDLAERLSE